MIWWHGVSSDDVHLIVERFPSRPLPRRKGESVPIPGRNGDYLEMQDAYENYIQPYAVYLSGEVHGHLPAVARAAARWLMVRGYQRLEDSYNLDEFRLAAVWGGHSFESCLNEFGRAEIEFNCDPRRFLKEGDIARPLSKGSTLLNPTGETALPILTLHGSGSGTLTIGGLTLSISNVNETTVDCELKQIYRGSTSLNSSSSGAFFALGDSAEVTWTGGITSVDIRPRWWYV